MLNRELKPEVQPADLASLSFSFPRPIAPETPPPVCAPHNPYLPSFTGLTGTIAVYGGSFDPIHLDHVRVALTIKEMLGDDTIVVFLPNKRNPDKATGPNVTSEQRLEMLTLALSNYDGLYVSDREMNSPLEKPMTFDTLEAIRSEVAPEARLRLVLGSDILEHSHYFVGIHDRKDVFEPLIVQRSTFGSDKVDALKDVLPKDDFDLVKASLVAAGDMKLSSTRVRNELAAGLLPVESLPPGVLDYIIANGLYDAQKAGN